MAPMKASANVNQRKIILFTEHYAKSTRWRSCCQRSRASSVAGVPDKCRRKKSASNNKVNGSSHITIRQSIFPMILVTVLFFLWGFANGCLDVLNMHLQQTLGITKGQGACLAAAYFGAYLVFPLTISGWILRRWGYRVTFMIGLATFGIGALMFWPSGVKRSFGGFCGSLLIVGAGLSTLQTSANPYIATCGPTKYSEMRLNLAQGFQAVGSVFAPVLASQLLFKGLEDSDGKSLLSVQLLYLIIAIIVFLLVVVFYFAPIPEITDSDMAEGEVELFERDQSTGYADKPLRKQYRLFWGVAAQFLFAGSQVAVANYLMNYVTEVSPGTASATASNLLAVGRGLFAIGRFIGSFAMKFVKPRHILLFFMAMIIVFIAAGIATTGNVAIAMMCLVLFFESAVFATIFSLALRGLGRHTKIGASILVSSICGGAVFPPILGAVADRWGTRTAMAVPLSGFLLAYSFPVWLNLFQAKELDAYRDASTGAETHVTDEEKEIGTETPASNEETEAGAQTPANDEEKEVAVDDEEMVVAAADEEKGVGSESPAADEEKEVGSESPAADEENVDGNEADWGVWPKEWWRKGLWREASQEDLRAPSLD